MSTEDMMELMLKLRSFRNLFLSLFFFPKTCLATHFLLTNCVVPCWQNRKLLPINIESQEHHLNQIFKTPLIRHPELEKKMLCISWETHVIYLLSYEDKNLTDYLISHPHLLPSNTTFC